MNSVIILSKANFDGEHACPSVNMLSAMKESRKSKCSISLSEKSESAYSLTQKLVSGGAGGESPFTSAACQVLVNDT